MYDDFLDLPAWCRCGWLWAGDVFLGPDQQFDEDGDVIPLRPPVACVLPDRFSHGDFRRAWLISDGTIYEPETRLASDGRVRRRANVDLIRRTRWPRLLRRALRRSPTVRAQRRPVRVAPRSNLRSGRPRRQRRGQAASRDGPKERPANDDDLAAHARSASAADGAWLAAQSATFSARRCRSISTRVEGGGRP